MTNRSIAIASLVAASLVSGAGVARLAAQQWKTKAPAAADWAAMAKLPDFNGVWEIARIAPAGRAGGGGRGGGRGADPARGTLPPQPQGPQLTPAYAAKKKELDARRAEDNDTANCLPPGMPGIMGQPYPMEFILSPGKVTIVIEAYTQVRHIYTDGRPLPSDPDPKFFGTSVGRWEGDTLVVDTVGFSDLTQLAANTPHSDKMRIQEKFRLTGPDLMTIETTVTDPEALTAPWTSTRAIARHRDWTISEYICEENNRNFVDSTGKAGVKLDNPAAKE